MLFDLLTHGLHDKKLLDQLHVLLHYVLLDYQYHCSRQYLQLQL